MDAVSSSGRSSMMTANRPGLQRSRTKYRLQTDKQRINLLHQVYAFRRLVRQSLIERFVLRSG